MLQISKIRWWPAADGPVYLANCFMIVLIAAGGNRLVADTEV